jgi:glutathione S-transferase
LTARAAKIVLYAIPMSHPAYAAQLMLAQKRLNHRVRQLPAGLHPLLLRMFGFEGSTVPAIAVEGRRAQGSLQISRLLDEMAGDPPLFPADPAHRHRVEAAERWGEDVYQPLPRRLFRWAATVDLGMRTHIARESRLPLPRLTARVSRPATVYFARSDGADEGAVRADLAALPGHIDHVDRLIEAKDLDADPLNAADFQIGMTSRILMNFPQLRAMFGSRPAAEHALRVCPTFGKDAPFEIPHSWLGEPGRLRSPARS